jgi:hypothetical protein
VQRKLISKAKDEDGKGSGTPFPSMRMAPPRNHALQPSRAHTKRAKELPVVGHVTDLGFEQSKVV